MSVLLSPVTIGSTTFRNRVVVSPMCQYSARHGVANDWHFGHLARFAIGGFGFVMVEATAASPEGRITYGCLGLWDDAQIAPLARIAAFLKSQGAVAGIQIGHAGRKASAPLPWRGAFNETEADKARDAFEQWQPVAPSAILHSPAHTMPRELTPAEIEAMPAAFAAAVRRADAAGFDVVEMHGAHGYLINSFLSPHSNKRTDQWGGSLENRMRLPLAIASAMRAAWPAGKLLLARLSVTDHVEGGWTTADSIVFANRLKEIGFDMIDCSSGGFAEANIPTSPLYQLPLAEAVKSGTGLPTIAVGLFSQATEAESAIADGKADMVALARTALDDPNWPLHARFALGGLDDPYSEWPKQAGYAVRNRDRALKLGGFAPKG